MIVSYDGFKLKLPDKSDDILIRLLSSGKYEPSITKFVRSQLRLGFNFVDVGASFGYYTILGAKAGCNVFSFEPNPFVYRYLRENVLLNHCEKLVKTYNFALGEKERFGYLKIPKKNVGHAYISVKPTKVKIKIKRLDDIIKDRINLLKLDVEGYELNVLKGSTRLMENGLINVIVFEYRGFLHIKLNEIIDLLNQFGFMVYKLRRGRLTLPADGIGMFVGLKDFSGEKI